MVLYRHRFTTALENVREDAVVELRVVDQVLQIQAYLGRVQVRQLTVLVRVERILNLLYVRYVQFDVVVVVVRATVVVIVVVVYCFLICFRLAVFVHVRRFHFLSRTSMSFRSLKITDSHSPFLSG